MLNQRMTVDGYLYLEQFLDVESVSSARQALLGKLSEGGFVDTHFPLDEAVSRGKRRLPLHDRSSYAKSIRTLPELVALNRHPRLMSFFEQLLGGSILNFEYIWIRAARGGEATGCHYDHVYMGRGTSRLYTIWIPLGEVPLVEGPLAVLEGSQQFDELIQTYGQLDVDRDKDRLDPTLGGWLTLDPNEPQNRYGGRWLSTDFCAGDVLIFPPFTMHCSLDNRSPNNRIRLSIDIRKQLTVDPVDLRWIGVDPTGHGG